MVNELINTKYFKQISTPLDAQQKVSFFHYSITFIMRLILKQGRTNISLTMKIDHEDISNCVVILIISVTCFINLQPVSRKLKLCFVLKKAT